MADHGVRNVFLPPTALKLMRQAGVRPGDVNLRSIFTGGESLGAELLDWVRTTFGIDAHEVYGQTECNLVVGNNAKLFPIRPGSMGKATPGFDVRIVDEQGKELPRGERGIIGVRQPNPVHHARILAQPGGHGEESTPANSCSPAISACRMRTAISGTSAARTTSSPSPAIASGRRRSSTRCSSIRRWRCRRWSAFPIRSAPRRSRRGSCCARDLRRATRWRARSRIS